ncbi:MAG: LL-diaminopimelate aminotransferase [Eubacteriales bacterium]|jgi:LL-diaminopimelate aminotransferase|nr:LL-diaminopimelate aminotransferase [Clostridiales bacterium]
MKINENFAKMTPSYLFAEISNRVKKYKEEHPEADVIRLGIGDVTLPLAPAVVEAAKLAADEMGRAETFRGYPPYEGWDFLIEAIRGYYASFGVKLNYGDIFVSDGAKSDAGDLPDLFSADNTVLVPDPVYPVYVDANIMGGRRIIYARGNKDNNFLPTPGDIDGGDPDIIYLCSPNNPTGATMTREGLREWVDYANRIGAVIIFDAAYEAFISDPHLPRSIFEIEGARECAIELGSLSKTAGFTGTRCGYTIIPEELERDGAKLNKLWMRRQSTKFNGVSYIVQRAAAAVFTPEGLEQCRKNIAYYRENAAIIAGTLDRLGIYYTGGAHSPYIWMRCPDGMGSWEFFDLLLQKANVVGTPGAGFGSEGEGYFRLTAFGSREDTAEASRRIEKLLSK